MSNLSTFFPSGQKKISSGRVKKYPGQSQVSLLFTAGQKQARVGSGPISIIETLKPIKVYEKQ